MGLRACLCFMYNFLMKIDWKKIEHDCVVNGINQRDLSKKYGVSVKTISVHSKEGGWIEKRREYRKETSAKLQQKSMDFLVKNVDRAIAILAKDLEILDQISDRAEEVILTAQTPGREMESKIKAATLIIDKMRELAGIMSPKDAEKARLDREKFELEKRKADMDESNDRTVKVVFTGELEDLSE